MAKYCADCTYFNVKDKKAPGFCKCSKVKKHVLANNPRCDKFDEAYTRGWYDREKLYDDAKETMNKPSGDKSSIGSSLALAIALVILAIIVNIFMK